MRGISDSAGVQVWRNQHGAGIILRVVTSGSSCFPGGRGDGDRGKRCWYKAAWSEEKHPWVMITRRGGWSWDARCLHSGCQEREPELLLGLAGRCRSPSRLQADSPTDSEQTTVQTGTSDSNVKTVMPISLRDPGTVACGSFWGDGRALWSVHMKSWLPAGAGSLPRPVEARVGAGLGSDYFQRQVELV